MGIVNKRTIVYISAEDTKQTIANKNNHASAEQHELLKKKKKRLNKMAMCGPSQSNADSSDEHEFGMLSPHNNIIEEEEVETVMHHPNIGTNINVNNNTEDIQINLKRKRPTNKSTKMH